MTVNNRKREKLILLGLLYSAAAPATSGFAAALDVRRISDLANLPATITADGVVRITLARTDVAVKVDGVSLKPSLGLTSWAAFKSTPTGAVLVGETVVFEDEVDAVMDAALTTGLHVTALHGCFFHDEPRVHSMHIAGDGSAEKLVLAVRSVWDAIRTLRARRPEPAKTFGGRLLEPGRLDARAIERTLEHKTESQDGIVKVTISREGVLRTMKIAGTMGLTTWAAFVGDDDLAVMHGEIAVTADEVQPVLRALRKEKIHVLALHNHMIGEQPPFFFASFRAKGKSKDLAKAFAAVLRAQEEASKTEKVNGRQ